MSKLVNTGFPSPGSQRASFAFIADEQEERTVALDHCPKLKFVLILNASYSTFELLVNHLLFSVSPYGDSIIRIISPAELAMDEHRRPPRKNAMEAIVEARPQARKRKFKPPPPTRKNLHLFRLDQCRIRYPLFRFWSHETPKDVH
jgi:hypothetical protein